MRMRSRFTNAGSFSVILTLCPLCLCGSFAEQPLVLSAPVTHSDWMLRPGADWGPAGVRTMLDTCKAAGLTRIYWRALDGGRSMYRSKLLDPQGKWEDDNFWRPVTPEDRKLSERYGIPSEAERQKVL